MDCQTCNTECRRFGKHRKRPSKIPLSAVRQNLHGRSRAPVWGNDCCIKVMDAMMHDLRCKRIQSDEIRTFVTKKDKHVKPEDPTEFGDAWVFVAIDPDTKLIPSFKVGKRDRLTTRTLRTLSARASLSIHNRRLPFLRKGR